MAAVDVASVVPSAAGPPPSAAVPQTCANVGKAAACAHGLSCVSASGEGLVLSQPAGASTTPVEGPPAQVTVRACVAAGSAQLVEPGATARGCEPD